MVDKDLYIVGDDGPGDALSVANTHSGTLWGVYDILERELGVHWLWPGALGESIPAAKDVRLPAVDRTIRPRFSWRYSYYGVNMAHPEFAARLRNNAVTDRPELGGRSPWALISHSVNLDVPVAKLGKDHPDYFSLVDGKRRSFMQDDQFEQGGTQPCFTNPEVKTLITRGVLDRLRAQNQTNGNISISQNDNTMYCRCDRCRAIDEREGTTMGALLTLVNEVGQAVARERTGVFVGTLAYQFSRVPPRHLKPGPNVAIQLCSIEACQIHPLNDPKCPNNVAFCKDLEGWCRISNNVYVWNYNTNFTSYNSPCPNLDIIGPNVRFLAAHGVNGVFMQAAGNAQNTELCDLRNYVISRLLWDPSLEGSQLVDEFVNLHYGRAADQVRAYLKLIGETARNWGRHQNCFGGSTSYGIDAKVARQALEILDMGVATAENDEVRSRVEKVSIAPRTVLIEPFARWARNHSHQIGTSTPPKAPPEVYSGIEPELREVFALYEKHKVDRFAEWVSMAEVRATLPESLLK